MKKKNKRKYLYLLIIPALLLVYVGFSYIYYSKLTDKAYATMSEQDYYVVTSKGSKDSIVVVMGKDSTAFVTYTNDTLFLNSITKCYSAIWVNKYWFNSCHGRLVTNKDFVNDNIDNQKVKSLDLKAFITKEKKDINDKLNTFERQQKEIDYYFSSHQLQDEGFDIVIRRKELVDRAVDSLKRIKKTINTIDSLGKLQILEEHKYMTNGILCNKIDSYDDNFAMFQTVKRHTPSNARPIYIGRLSSTKYKVNKPSIPALPTDTTYIGKRDSIGRYRGQGILSTRTGFYYEGEFDEGEPDGFGVAFDHRVRAGKWVNGRYRGEQPTYSANHIYGIDVSRYQHESVNGKKHWSVDWKNVRVTSLGTLSKKNVNGEVNFPVSFVFIKATEGVKLKNKYYYYDYKNARANGLRVGSYHFFSTKTSASNQADFFLAFSKYQKGDMPPVLDLEPTPAQIRKYGGSNTILWAARVWLEKVEKKLGVKPILYVDHLFFNKYLSDDSTNRLTSKYDVWISRYGQYKPIGHLRFWQLCPDGHVSGIHPAVDINIFNGTAEAFKNYNK